MQSKWSTFYSTWAKVISDDDYVNHLLLHELYQSGLVKQNMVKTPNHCTWTILEILSTAYFFLPTCIDLHAHKRHAHCQCQAHIYVLRKQIRLENADPRIHLLIHNKQKNPTWKGSERNEIDHGCCFLPFVCPSSSPAKWNLQNPKDQFWFVCLFSCLSLTFISGLFHVVFAFKIPFGTCKRKPPFMVYKQTCVYACVGVHGHACVCVRVHVHLCIQHTYVLMCLLTASRCIVHWTEHIHLYPSACSHIILTWNCFFAERIVRFPAFCTMKDPPAPLSSASELVQ